MLKVLMSLFFLGGAGASYFGFSGGDQTLAYGGLIIAAVFLVVLFFMFMKAIGCIVTVIVLAVVLLAIAYFGGFIKFPFSSDCQGDKCAEVAVAEESGGFWTRLMAKMKGNNQEQPPKEQLKISGTPTVIDGNTIRVDGIKIHLYGVEAPRQNQICRDKYNRDFYCGAVSTEKLAVMLGTDPVNCTIIGKKNSETFGVCVSGDDDIGSYLIGLGYAFPNPEYGQVYFPYENNAKSKNLGLWDGNVFLAPWDWDKMQTENSSSSRPVVVPAKKNKEERGMLWKNFFN